MAVVTVLQWQRAVRFDAGVLAGVLGPGRHRYRASRTMLHTVDLRPRVLTVPGQDVLTQDGLTVRISLLLTWQVAEPAQWVQSAQDPMDLLYAAAQSALRTSVGAVGFDDLIASRDTLAGQVIGPVTATAETLGATVSGVAVKDLMLPAELRAAAAQTVLARERGKAELERARAEAAALRSLANTARLLEEHPALLHLRTLQAAGTPGTTVVLTPPREADAWGDAAARTVAPPGPA
jgi:regulator of protease activity HflC (stomatin/prohibitin superfamily)